MSVIYYSNKCPQSQKLLQELAHMQLNPNTYFINVDNRTVEPNGKQYIVLENGQKIIMPTQYVTRVPALFVAADGNRVEYGVQAILQAVRGQQPPQQRQPPNGIQPNRTQVQQDQDYDTYSRASTNLSDQYSSLDAAYSGHQDMTEGNYIPFDADIRIHTAAFDGKASKGSDMDAAAALAAMQQRRDMDVPPVTKMAQRPF
jgi:glutaredoxin-related protein